MAEALPDWAARYVGIPYKVGGADYHGCDCLGLIALAMREQFGWELPPYSGAHWHHGQSAELVGGDAATYASRYRTVEAGLERTGDVILIRMRGHPLHVGLVIKAGFMLHCHEDADACVEPYRTPMWEKRILGFYRYEEL
jgi:cell wall-associated NlpC family hydrolase